ncbi:hypothetical protein K466DRAFT_601917 [Polyporus arcularius HHB13444]|uniref:F-box domain-containing protein n=1 Tax=Polyporus arcularius HHB13444 TaxID=1314778 RepID=A0A5C3P699_9APHY|nr:hypothetical protein K466DRAFT_601917 [Polyporus arcularius HHB13444]
MDESRLPLELCELILDASGCEFYVRLRYDTLRACALTCKGWHPRSRYNLLHRVSFRRPQQIERFLSTITANPALADLVHELHVTPADAHRHGFFPIANPQLVTKLRNMRHLALRQFNWDTFPPIYYVFVGKFNLVSSLQISNIMFHSPRDLVHLVRYLPKLNQLSCGVLQFQVSYTPEDCENLCVIRESSACNELYTLTLWNLTDFPPIIRAFGTKVIDMNLQELDASWPWEDTCASVTRYRYLRSISLSLTVDGSPDAWSPTPTAAIKKKREPLVLLKEHFTSLLRSIRSDYMHTISIQLSPSMERSAGGTWHMTYHGTRALALDLICGQEVRDALNSGPLVNLTLLYVHVQENSLAHDAEWWCKTLRERLGPVPREIRAHVDYYAPDIPRGIYSYEQLWGT